MNRPLTIIGATALLMVQCHAQQPTQNDISPLEFRQVLLDLGSYLDAHKGTDLRARFEALSDDALQQLHLAIQNPRRLQAAVAGLKENDSEMATKRLGSKGSGNTATADRLAAFPSCPANTIIDNSTGATCTPAYPDPTSSDWQLFINPLRTFGAFSPNDYASVSQQACGLKVETNLQQVTVAFQGAVAVGSAVCGALVPPAQNICWGVVAVGAAANAVSAGLYSDCLEQDGLVNAAEIDAGFHNTVTIYNALKGVDTHLTNVNTQITGEFSALDTHLTNVNTQITNEFTALDAHLVTLFNQLTNQITQGNALLGADLKQVMKLLLTPDGRKQLNPAILTCTGTNCPNVLANCPAAGCSWNDVGPLP